MKLVHKLMVTYGIIVLVVLIILGLVLSRSLSTHVYNQQQRQLSDIAQTIGKHAMDVNTGDASIHSINQAVTAIDQSLNVRIWVMNAEGRIIADSRMRMMQRRGATLVPSDQINLLFQGAEISVIMTVDELDATMLMVGVPFPSDGQTAGAVLMLSPVSNVQATLTSIYRLFWPAASLSLLGAAILAIAVSRSISKPLRDLSKAASKLAQGDFDTKVIPSGDEELKTLANSFNEMASQLRELEHMRKDLIAKVSHELRTPLTSIRGFVQGVLDDKIPPQRQKEYLQRSLDEIRRLSNLVTNLLNLSAIEGKAASLDFQECHLQEVVNLSLAAIEPQIVNHQMSVQVDLPKEPAQVLADPGSLQQVLINIFSNTIQHTPQGGNLEVNLKINQTHFQLHIADSGPGIPEELLPHIFKPFFRGKNDGTGLGLTIARVLVDAHGGTISAHNRPSGGSEFVIQIPRHNKNLGTG